MQNAPVEFEKRIGKRAYLLWLAEGRPEGRADAHWRLARKLELAKEARRSRASKESARKTIAFVCCGNTCRSAMAEQVAEWLWYDLDTNFTSAGIRANEGDPMARMAVCVLEVLEIPVKPHAARRLPPDISDLDLFIALDRNAGTELESLGVAQSRLICRHIDDPIDRGCQAYWACAFDICGVLESIHTDVSRLLAAQ